MWNDGKKNYSVRLSEKDLTELKELKGYLVGLKVAGKDVPGLWTFKRLEEDLCLDDTDCLKK